MLSGNRVKILVLASFFLFAVSLGASVSDWKIETIGEPDSYQNISPGGGTIQFVNITYRSTGEPITESYMEARDGYAEWEYNLSGAIVDSGNLTHYYDGIYYVETDVHTDPNESANFNFEARRMDPLDEPTTASKEINVSPVNVDILTDMSGNYPPGQDDAQIEVNVTNSSSGQFLSNADLTVEFANTTFFKDQGFPEADDDRYRLYSLVIPDAVEKKYAFHVKAEYEEYTSVNTVMLETLNYLEHRVEEVSVSGDCDSDSMPGSCEPGTAVNVSTNITKSYAENVTLELLRHNETGLTRLAEYDMSENQDSGLYEQQFEFPDFDASLSEELALRVTSENNYSTYTNYYNISKAGMRLTPVMESEAFQGSDFRIGFDVERPYSGTPYPEDDIASVDVSITGPEDQTVETIGWDNFTYNPDTARAATSWMIEPGTPNGSYNLDVEVFNTDTRSESFNRNIAVRNVSRTFNVSDSVEVELSKIGNYTKNFSITNNLESEVDVVPDVRGDISDFTTINGGDALTLGSDNTAEFSLEFEVDQVEDYAGEIVLEDSTSDYNETINVELEAPDCSMRNGSFCIDTEEDWMNITRTEPGVSSREVDIYYMGEEDNVSVQMLSSGAVSSYIAFEPISFELSDSRPVQINYSSQSPVNVTGEIVFNSTQPIELPTAFVGDFEEPETDLQIPRDDKDLGVSVGDTATNFTIEVQNNGTVDIGYIEASGPGISIQNYTAIPPSGTETVELLLENGEYSGYEEEVTLTGYRTEGEGAGSTDSVQITAKFIPDAETVEEDLSSRKNNLESEASNPNILNDLTSVGNNVTTITDALEKGENQKAFNTYMATLEALDSIEEEIENNDQQNDQNQNDDNSDDQTGGTNDDNQDTGGTPNDGTEQQTEDGGGGGIIILLLIVVILLVAGFIFYTSYIPEPGDPLYEYLGEE